MKKTVSATVLLIFSFVFPLLSSAQSQDDKEKLLTAHRWGLAHFLQPYSISDDTLFSVRDCQNEFIAFKEDKSYQFVAQDKDLGGFWTLREDSVIVFKNEKKKKTRFELLLKRVTADSLILWEMYKDVYYIHIYTPCKNPQERIVEDTRLIYDEYKFTGLHLGLQVGSTSDAGEFGSPFLELGIAKGNLAWNNILYVSHASLQYTPLNGGLYGLNVGGYVNNSFVFGVNFNMLSDLEKVNFGMSPMLGIAPKINVGEYTRVMHLVYSYRILFLTQDINVQPLDGMNRHEITLRMVLPFRTRKVQVKKIPEGW